MKLMRNQLIHSYFRVNPNIVWNTVTKEIPKLIPQLEKELKLIEAKEYRENQAKAILRKLQSTNKSKGPKL